MILKSGIVDFSKYFAEEIKIRYLRTTQIKGNTAIIKCRIKNRTLHPL